MENAIRELLRSIYRFYRTFMVMVMRPSKAYHYLFYSDSKFSRIFTPPILFFILTSFLFAFVFKNVDIFFNSSGEENDEGWSRASIKLGSFI